MRIYTPIDETSILPDLCRSGAETVAPLVAQWDWYQTGGRWCGRLLVRDDAAYQRGGGAPSPLMNVEEISIARCSSFATFAVVTPDGRSYSKDEEADEETWEGQFFDRFLKNADLETIITIVDCHV
ncbi:MAG: hypothetical protein IMX00_03320 [Limnochordales bacterium]|nr:hypothetical protein [Limnochordales bacterium]